MGMVPDSQVLRRADARRNYERVLCAAKDAFSEHGTDVSLDKIARSAGVGNATLYRHFPTRDALLKTVLREQQEGLKANAESLLTHPDPGAALDLWIRAFLEYVRAFRGLPDSVSRATRDPTSSLYASCHAILETAGVLLRNAQSAGSIRNDIDATELCAQTMAVAWAGEMTGANSLRQERLLSILSDGLRAAT